MRTISHSQMQAMKDCPRKHYLEYTCRIRPVDRAKRFRFGSAVHTGIDMHSKGQTWEQIVFAVRAEYAKTEPTPGTDEHYKWQLECEISLRMISGYIWRYGDEDSEIRTWDSEIPFTMQIINPDSGRPSRTFHAVGKIDQLLQIPTNRVAVGEIKTTSDDISADSNYWKRLSIDAQISTYWLGAESLGHKIDTILYTVIRKPSISPKALTQGQTQELLKIGEYFVKLNGDEDETGVGKYQIVHFIEDDLDKVLVNGHPAEVIPGKTKDKETGRPKFAIRETVEMFGDRLTGDITKRPDFYYARREIARLKHDLEEHRYAMWQMAGLIRDCTRHGRWPRNDRQCLAYGTCEYFPLCSNGFNPVVDDLPDGFYIREKPEEKTNGNSTTETPNTATEQAG